MNIKIKKNRIIMHIDMNSYFASVEQQANPFLRGKSVAVCAHHSPNAIIIASSTEAKEKNIKTGMKLKDALYIDSDLRIIVGCHDKYRSTTKKIFTILRKYTNIIQKFSIDEAFLDLSSQVKNFNEAVELAKTIQEEIRKEVGEWLYSSVGISWTKFLAKFAGDIAPKKGILLIDNFEILDFLLLDRDMKDACGINIATEKRIKSLNIKSLYELKHANFYKLYKKLGKTGLYLWANFNGIEINEISNKKSTPKSIGHSCTIPYQNSSSNHLEKILHKLCEKVGRRLRASKLKAKNISISFSCYDNSITRKSITFNDTIYTTKAIFQKSEKIFHELRLTAPVKIISISVSALVPVVNQLSLFLINKKEDSLSITMDTINDKYGEFTITQGDLLNLKELNDNKIGFRKI